jgi:hypothetical protein
LLFDSETSRNVQRSSGRRQRRSANWSVLGPNSNQHCSDWPPDLYMFIYSRVCWAGRCLPHFDTGRCSSLEARDRTLMCNRSSTLGSPSLPPFRQFMAWDSIMKISKYRSSRMRCCVFSSDRSLLLSLRGWVRCLSPRFASHCYEALVSPNGSSL